MHESGTFYKRIINRRNTLASQRHLSLVFHSTNSTERGRRTSGLLPALLDNKRTSLLKVYGRSNFRICFPDLVEM